MEFYKLSDVLDLNSDCPIHIAEKYQSIFSNTECEFCGAPLVLNTDMTILRCSSESCIMRLSKSLAKIMQNLGIKGIGEATLLAHLRTQHGIVKRFQDAKTKAKALGVPLDDILPQQEGSTLNERLIARLSEYEEILHESGVSIAGLRSDLLGAYIQDIRNRTDFLRNPPADFAAAINEALAEPRTYSEAIRILNIPNLIERAEQLFGDCDNYDDFVEKMRKNGGMRNYIHKYIVKSEATVLRDTLVQQVVTYAPDLRAVPSIFTIRSSALVATKLVITGNIDLVTDDEGHKVSKQTYVRWLNNVLDKRGRRMVLHKRVTGATEILVCDAPGTSNYNDAVAINERRQAVLDRGGTPDGPLIIICTSEELLSECMREGSEENTVGSIEASSEQ